MGSTSKCVKSTAITSAALGFLAVSCNGLANENQAVIADQMAALCEAADSTNQPTFQLDSSSYATFNNFVASALTIEDAVDECSNYQELNDTVSYEAQVTPDEAPAQYTSLVQISSSQISNIKNHLSGKRQQQNSASETTAALHPELGNYYGKAAGNELFSSGRLSVFFSGATVDGNQDDTNYEVGYDLATDHYTLGVDLQINSEWLVGLAYGDTSTELEYSLFNDRTDNDTDHVLLYSSWYRKNFAVDTTLGYASGEFKTLRHLPDADATGVADNKMAYLSISGSYDFNQGGWSYGPLSGIDYLKGEIDAFEEQGNSIWNAAFDSQDVKSMIFTMGAQTAFAQSFSWGVVVPHAKVLWRYELEDDRDLIVGRFAIDPASDFAITPDDPDTSWYEVSVGLSAVMPHGISAFINYEEVLSYDDTDLSTISAGARLEF